MLRHTSVRVLIGLLLVVAVLGSPLAVAPASAHTLLGGSTPAADAIVRSADVIELRFTGPVRAGSAVFGLRGLSGTAPALSAPVFADDGTSVTLRPLAPLPDDRYRVAYQFVSADDHPTNGVLEFEVSRDGVARAPGWTTAETTPAAATQPQLGTAPDEVRPWVLVGGATAFVLLAVALLRLRPTRRSRPPGSEQGRDR